MTRTALTADQARRVQESLTETRRLLAKELSYQVVLQKQDMISFYRGHIEMLTGMLSLPLAA